MGNRAVITTRTQYENDGIGIYLHWNGGRDSVEAFLKYCELKDFRSLTDDADYGFARLTQVISNFFGGTTSIGVGKVNNLDCDNGDNGLYIIEGWNIVDRLYFDGVEQSEYDLVGMLCGIDEKQPLDQQLAPVSERYWIMQALVIGENAEVESTEVKSDDNEQLLLFGLESEVEE